MRKCFIVLLSFHILTAYPAYAGSRIPLPTTPFIGTVQSCHDGDTCWTTSPVGPIRVRLHICDSPEEPAFDWGYQPGADEARDMLRNLIQHKPVTVLPAGRDGDRLVADVYLGKINVCAYMLARGMAMVHPSFADDNPAMLSIQRQAIIQRRGVWAEKPIEPWRWRRKGH